MILDNLNQTQKEAVLHTEGPLMVLAGAGSGKTKMLVSRIAYLIEEKQVGPYRVLALTFSNKAAKEMRERIVRSIAVDIGALQVTTFHSFCARLLRNEAQYIGLSKNFTIYDDGESRAIIKNLLSRAGISPKELSPYDVLYTINQIKNWGYFSTSKESIPDEFEIDNFTFKLFQEYERELHKANALDFGGLLTAVLQLFHDCPEVLERYQKRFSYVLVDEYQDTNRAQFNIVHQLSMQKRNLCVVGDEDQSIYSWRGADINNILDFEKFYPDAKLVKLEQNYRSTKSIIAAASEVIKINTQRKDKQLWTANDDGDAIKMIECGSDTDEATYVVSEITKLYKNKVPLSDIAVFYRTNAQSRIIEDALRNNKIQYRILGGIKFYERKEIKDILSYLRIIVNSKDSLALSRIINVPARGLGATSLRKLEQAATDANVSLWEIIVDVVDNQEKYEHIKLTAKVKASLREFGSLIHELMLMETNGDSPSQIASKAINNSGYFESIRANKDYEALARIENIEELINAIKQYENKSENPSVSGFLEGITLDSSVDAEQTDEHEKGNEVVLMTIHGAKGLEFPYVFVTGLEENIFPSYQSLGGGEYSIEEERRLFYVAMTRAMKLLHLSFANGRMQYGSVRFNPPSRFLDEIPARYVNQIKISNRFESSKHKDQNSSWEDYHFNQTTSDFDGPVLVRGHVSVKDNIPLQNKSKFTKGVSVKHSLYGAGTILSVEGSGADEKVTIKFRDGSSKKFMIKFAPLEII